MSSVKTNPATDRRPLSPHLQVWKWTITMALSIFHRASGVALSIGTLMIVWWLMAAASGPAAYETFTNFAGSFLGQLMLLGWTAALFYHMLSGIRHLLMDCGFLFEIKDADRAGIIIFVMTIILTLITWVQVWSA
jgi:succinate dehydrogenase / fumarate reductase cytochrome b subunit